ARLAPYFPESPFAKAKEAFDRGLYPKALELVAAAVKGGAPLSPEAAYLRALALLRVAEPLPADEPSGRSRADALLVMAARELFGLVDRSPALRDPCRFSAGVALEEAGLYRAAAEAYGQLSPASPLHGEAQLGRARALAAAGDVAGALSALAPLRALAAPVSGVGRDLGAEALYASAALELRRGKPDPSIEDDMALWLRHPAYRLAAAARAQAEALAQRDHRAAAVTPSALELTLRAERLLAAHRLEEARAAFAALAVRLPLASKAPAPLACRVGLGLGKALRMLRRHGEAIATLTPVVDRCLADGEGDLRERALYVLGSSASIVDPPRGEAIYERLATDYPQSSLADDALFYEADLEARAGEAERARATLERLARRYPDGDFAVDARFKLFWLARAAGHPEAGLADLDQIARRLAATPLAEPLLRARYWRAVTRAASPDAAERAQGARELSALAREAPFSYYGALALGRLPAGDAADRPPPAPTALPISLHAGTLIADPAFQAGVELLRLGFPEAAARELDSVDRRGLTGPTGAEEPLLLLALALDRAGDHQRAHALAKAALRGPRPEGEGGAIGRAVDPGSLVWRIAYPLAFRPEIERWASAVSVPPDLMQALMREESALDPLVVSGAGAVGLTQLMPQTAAKLAHRLGLGRVTAALLAAPELNIRLGCFYVSQLLRRFKDNPALALAAYNAGEGAVDRWLAARGGEPLDAFVEEIPIAETRGYVKRVLETYATYRYLYGQGDGRLSRFGEKLLAAF
ncbi:MAG: transglycosylase SLT domain-containing protein, partial [Deltaproteobacteria bacterium]